MKDTKPVVGEGYLWFYKQAATDLGISPKDYLKEKSDGPIFLSSSLTSCPFNFQDYVILKVIYSAAAMCDIEVTQTDIDNEDKIFGKANYLLLTLDIDSLRLKLKSSRYHQRVVLYNPASQILDAHEVDRSGDGDSNVFGRNEDTFFIVDTDKLSYEQCLNWDETPSLRSDFEALFPKGTGGVVVLHEWVPDSRCSVYRFSKEEQPPKDLDRVFEERIDTALEVESFVEWSVVESFSVSMHRVSISVHYNVELFDLVEYFEHFMPIGSQPRHILNSDGGGAVLYKRWLQSVAVRVLAKHSIQIEDPASGIIKNMTLDGDRATLTYSVSVG